MRILFLANWRRSKALGGDYAFFKHFAPRPELDVLTTFALPLWTRFEQRVLKFYPLQALIAWLRSSRYDLLIAYSSQSGLPLALLRRLLGERGVPLIVFDVENLGRLGPNVSRLARWALQSVQCIVAPSSGQLDYYRRLGPEVAARARFAPIGIGPYPPTAPLDRALAGQRIVVLGKADQGPRFRDWPLLLEALELVVVPFELLIVGRESLADAERDGRPLPPNTRFASYIPTLELVELLGSCRFSVLPLPDRRQSQGQLSALLVMACGRTLVAPRVLGLTDYLEHESNALLYEAGDARAMAKCIQRLLQDDRLCVELGARAQSDVKQRFSDVLMGRAWQQICEEVLRR
ncbi:MAG: glycosyltransferase family 4 protein [Candidatus Alcyoniella australis]|nr:glycosyltransferase family 4 protein [Candidatus Alcyoniella australis]